MTVDPQRNRQLNFAAVAMLLLWWAAIVWITTHPLTPSRSIRLVPGAMNWESP